MMRRLLVITILCMGGAAACVSEQELGSHATADAATPTNDGGPAGADGNDAGRDSDGSPSSDGGVDAELPPKLFFVTENRYSGDLKTEGTGETGPLGADHVCMQEAKAAHVSGVFKAWLSTSTQDAKDRFAPVGPWFTAVGISSPIAMPATIGPQLDGALIGVPQFTIGGTMVQALEESGQVWTGTGADGRRDVGGRLCADWTTADPSSQGSYGVAGTVAQIWTEYRGLEQTPQADKCSKKKRIYCFEQ